MSKQTKKSKHFMLVAFAGFFLAMFVANLSFTSKVYSAGARCASESTSADRVLEDDCGGYYTGHFDDPKPFNAEPNKCYFVERPYGAGQSHPSGAHDDFKITEVPCNEFESLLYSATSSKTNLEGDCEEDTNNDGSTIDPADCGITSYIKTFINVLSAIVGIVIVIMFAVRGIQFSTARDNAQQVAQAKEQMFWLVMALVVYMFSFAILQWLVPGGLF